MRARVTAFLLVTTLATFFLIALVPAAHASMNLAQEDTTTEDEGVIGQEDESEGSEGGDTTEGDSGQSDEEAETGADEGETAEGQSTEEEGPPWTYQMARIGIVLMLLVAGLIGYLYYKMIILRQRGEA